MGREADVDWIKQRITTAIEAFTLRRVLAVGGIFAVAGAVAGLAPKIKWGGLPMFLSTPAWIWGLIAALISGLYFVFEYAHRKRLETVPKIALSFNPDCVVHTPTKIRQVVQGNLVEIDSHACYVCLKVESLSKLAIRDCAALITSIKKRNRTTGQFAPIPLADAIAIRVPFIIYHGVPNYVAFLQAGENDNTLRVPERYPLIIENAFNEHTVYRVTISVIADGVTSRHTVDVTWAGVWNGLTAVSYNPA